MPPQEPTPQVFGPSPAPVPTEPAAPLSPTPAPVQNKKGFPLFVIFLLAVIVLGLGALGYLYYATSKDLKDTKKELTTRTEELANARTAASDQLAVSDFMATENNAELSRSLCGGQPLGMFDVHLNDKFAVFRYLCANQDFEAPIRIGALKRLPDGAYEFTYGSTPQAPNALPDYIYNSEPEFFGNTYGAQLF